MTTPAPDLCADVDRLRTALEVCLATPFIEGNSIERLRNGDQIFPAMLEAIAAARETVDLETFVYWGGDIADEFACALSAAAARGVRVRVLLDAVGSIPMPARIRRILDESDAEVRSFRPPVRWRIWELGNRTHRKILVCDDVAFTGGVGIADEWTGDARNPDEWRESHFALRGSAVRLLRGVFLEHWLEAMDEDEDDARVGAVMREAGMARDPHPSSPVGADGGGLVQVVRSGAGVGWTDVQTLLRTLIANAERSLRITTAYFVPDEGLVQLLCDAAGRGVAVDVLNPGPHTDHRISQLAGEDVFQALLDCGVRIRRYLPTMLHAKVITVDGVLSVIGSANFNHRSFARDDEICVNVLDPELTRVLDEDFEADAAQADDIDPTAEWARRSAAQRVGEWVARRFRHQL